MAQLARRGEAAIINRHNDCLSGIECGADLADIAVT